MKVLKANGWLKLKIENNNRQQGGDNMFGIMMLLVSVTAIYLVWKGLKKRPIHSDMKETTSGQVLKFGQTYILHCPATVTTTEDNTSPGTSAAEGSKVVEANRLTIVCFPGFLETMQYFTDLYKHQDVDVIIINNFDYHNPFQDNVVQNLDWKEVIPYREGTIAYDASIVNLVIKHLVKTDRVILHGHSRGGAVALDAVRQNQQRFSDIDLLLEAPILPQAFLPKATEIMYYYGAQLTLPFLIPLVNRLPPSVRQKSPLFVKMTERKSELLTPMLANPNNVEIIFKQVKDILQWPAVTTYDAFNHGQSCTIVLGESDNVLSRRRMKASALQAEANALVNPYVDIKIVETKDTDHFISIEQPEQIKSVIEAIISRPDNKRVSAKKNKSIRKVD